MGLIKEPLNVDFYVDSTPLSKKEMNEIHDAIAYYKKTGKIKTEDSELNYKIKAIRPKTNRKVDLR